MESSSRSLSGLLYQFIAGLIFVATLVLVHANVEAGMNDDWSFVRTVHDLAATGHIRYNGWSAPLLGMQAYWGALFVKIFGFSFLAVRASCWVLTLISIPVLWGLLRRAELNEKQAFFGLLAFLLSPLNLPNLATFMTDIPAFLFFAGALLSALKAWGSADERRALLWVCSTTACGILSGSVRQIYWLSGICFLGVLGCWHIRSTRGRAVIAACIGLTVSLGAACSHWLAAQPYVPADSTLQAWHNSSWTTLVSSSLEDVLRELIGMAVLSLPFTLPLCWLAKRKRPYWMDALILAVAFAIPYWMADPLPWLGNTITNYGVLLNGTVSIGDTKPELLSQPFMNLLAGWGIASGIYAVLEVRLHLRSIRRERVFEFLKNSGPGRVTSLAVPFLVAYMAVLAVRATAFGLFDRYMIPHIFVASVLGLSVYARRKDGISWMAIALAGIFALYAIGTTHDYFAEARAKLQATNQVLASGYRRDMVLSGFEFDLWTQVESTGHVNNKLVTFPRDAYHEMEDCNGGDDVDAWWRSMAPALQARYVISLSPLIDLKPTEFPRIDYSRWLPPAANHVYTEKLADKDPPLTCKSGSGD